LPQIRIRLLGRVQIVHEDGKPVHLPPIVENLFAYIILTQYRNQFSQGLRRELLANLFWEDQPERNARRCLSTALWRLRREFQLSPTTSNLEFITTTSDKVSLNIDFDHWLDIDQFEQLAIHGLSKPLELMTPGQATSLETAIQLYTGDLLEDCYEDWAIQERERLHLLYLRCLARLMRYFRHHGRYEECVKCGKQILQTDPLREQIHRELMLLYLENNQRQLAIHQYEMCRQILKRELGIEPMNETQLLYAQLIAEKRPLSLSLPENTSPTMDQLMLQLQKTMSDLEQTQAQLHHIQQMLINMNQSA
jgi:DNA-binding SARP family transcriptional activator